MGGNHIIALIAVKWLLQYCTGPRSWGWEGGGVEPNIGTIGSISVCRGATKTQQGAMDCQ